MKDILTFVLSLVTAIFVSYQISRMDISFGVGLIAIAISSFAISIAFSFLSDKL